MCAATDSRRAISLVQERVINSNGNGVVGFGLFAGGHFETKYFMSELERFL